MPANGGEHKLSLELSLEEEKFLVELARKAVEEYLKSRKRISASENISEKLLQPCGVFVTINTIRDGEKELRGCSRKKAGRSLFPKVWLLL